MRNQMFPCPACGSRTQIIRTEVPTAAFQLGPRTPDMARMATLVECTNEDDCGYGWEVQPVTAAAVAAVAQLDADLLTIAEITDENARAQARAEAEQRFLTAAAGDEPS